MEVLIFAFTSRSSAGALPLNVQTQTRRLGVPEGIANFAATFGLSIGQNGCAGIYPAMLAIMVAPVANVEIDLQFIVTLIAVVIISSFGVGVGGATFASILVLSTLNLPVALAGVLISVEPLIDMGRTALNVNDSMLAGTGTAKLTKHWDKDTFESNDNAALTSHLIWFRIPAPSSYTYHFKLEGAGYYGSLAIAVLSLIFAIVLTYLILLCFLGTSQFAATMFLCDSRLYVDHSTADCLVVICHLCILCFLISMILIMMEDMVKW